MQISIIGGGITGMCTAISLQKLGVDCTVYEKTPILKKVGAGIMMAANAMKAYKWMGIDEQVESAGFKVSGADITNDQLVPFRKFKADTYLDDGYGTSLIVIWRARLFEVLQRKMKEGSLVLGKEYVSHKEEKGNIKIQFKDAEIETDLLIGADGIHSKVRKQLFPDSSLRYTGQSCWRGMVEYKIPESISSVNEAWGADKTRFGICPVSKDLVYWFAVQSAEEGLKVHPGAVKKELNQLFKNYAPIVTELINATEEEKIMHNDLYDLKRLEKWHYGKVCLLGDAGHATSPNMGQGGAQGVEDAYYFANLLNKYIDNPTKAFEEFEHLRRKKVDMIVNNSWMFGKMAHSYLGCRMMKLVMKWSPESMIKKQMQQVYHLHKVKEFV